MKNTKNEIIFSFCRRKERKGNKNVYFLHPALFFITPRGDWGYMVRCTM